MNINELKIGDRVKYYYPEDIICDTTIGEGILTWIGLGDSIINTTIKIPTKDIISKLELQYKETLIEKVFNKEEIIDFSDLNIGDTVIYKYVDAATPLGYIETTGKILEFKNEFVYVSDDSLTGSRYKIHMMLILYKLDYSEYNKEFKKTRVMWGIKPQIKIDKSAPKSFKFDIRITEFSEEIKRYGMPSTNKIGGYSISDGTFIKFENFPAPEWIDLNKEYTIEIKEKK